MKKIILAAAAFAALSTVAFADADSVSKSFISNGYAPSTYVAGASAVGVNDAPEAFAAVPDVQLSQSNEDIRLFEKGGSYSWIN